MTGYLRPGLPELPPRIEKLPRYRGYPVPWFVAWFSEPGVACDDREPGAQPDFRVVRADGVSDALVFSLCWVCGERIGRHVAYTIGPMCAVNRISAEPPSHRECAVFSATACPFLTNPDQKRREAGPGLKDVGVKPPGEMIARNPGVSLVWVTHGINYSHGLFNVGDPDETLWFCEGREATRAEVMRSIDSGLPILQEMADAKGPRASRKLARMYDAALELVPTEAAA